GGKPGWNQKWRSPLRAGLGTLGETLASLYEKETAGLFKDPWEARNGYIRIIEERTREAAVKFVSGHASRELSPAEISRALSLLECQRNAQLMFTSCGWFFSDISGLETVQIMRYAARAIELAGTAQWLPLEKKLLADLKGALSNVPGMGTGANIYNGTVKDSIVSRPCLVALYAITSHLSGKERIDRIYGRPVRSLGESVQRIAEDYVKIGSLEITSRITLEAAVYEYLLYVEDEASFVCFVRERRSEAEFREMIERIGKMARAGLISEIRPAASEYFGGKRFTIRDFLPEDRERILRRFTAKRLEIIESRFAGVFDDSKHLLLLLKDANIPVPQNILIPAQTHLTKHLVAEVEQWERSLNPSGLAGIRKIVTQASTFGIPIDTSSAAASFSDLILENVKQLADRLDAGAASALEQFVNLADEMGIRTNYRDIQNRLYEILETKISPLIDELSVHPGEREETKSAIAAFLRLARRFNFNTDPWDKRLGAL
ncbi:MAG: DUF3536 domain-containing protein, partial [Candidatus Krumholzibacteria bacterium]|nr:DUF3536 domain-containing protein [Candidatus Krumholzibacteria bacterium]